MTTTSEPNQGSPQSADDSRAYDDIPGTYVFDARRSRLGYALNMMCMSLAQEVNRVAMRADESAYLDQWDLTSDQRESIEKREWTRMLKLGGNVYYTFKLAAFDGMTFRNLAAGMTGVTDHQFGEMMIAGGRPIDGNRSISEAATTSRAATNSEAATTSEAATNSQAATHTDLGEQ